MSDSSTQGVKTVLHPVSDLAAAKAMYGALLGVPPLTDSEYYVGFEAEGQQIGLVRRHRPRRQRPRADSGSMSAAAPLVTV